ncbi:MAG: hypothetical protein F7C81_01615 [Desulfurococcales archaeon]|nr:hypothetical protein [Desulfurococcales archaeon]
MSGERRKKRMTMPKKREDLERIVEEVEATHAHEHGHEHHHHHGDVDEVLTVMELLIDSLNATVKNLEARLNQQSMELARIYKVLAYIVQSLAHENRHEKAKALKEAIKILEST